MFGGKGQFALKDGELTSQSERGSAECVAYALSSASNQFRSSWQRASKRASGVRWSTSRKKCSVAGSTISLPSSNTRPSASTR